MTQDFHTYREIRQQPRVWRKAYDIIRARKAEIQDFLNVNLDKDFTIVLTGAGTSAYIGDALEPALSKVKRGVRAIATTDIITDPGLYFDENSKVLLVSFARSGNSPESVGAVKAVEKTAGKVAHVFITCNENGELAKMKGSNILTILLPPETNDVSLAMTSSYSTMLIVCSMIARIDNIEEDKESIDLLAAKVEEAMDRYETKIKEIADRDFTRAIFLGSGPLKGVAEESRLKLQELTDGAVMCAFDSFLGFRHGPKALVNPDSMLVYLLSNKPEIQRYELDLIRQIKSNNDVKASVIVCQQKPALEEGCYDLCVEIGLPASVSDYYACVSYIFVGQLLGFFKSIATGLSPDSPSVSGNISRVVEGVTLYL
ncbi:MAG: SIS domain-containing protein [Bacteroidales bacterium]|nr:SIS domain-containing protein [Bacteroidales bacterium]MBR6865039.1 SIS domain-containing protein [Bacteroidales bacterium]